MGRERRATTRTVDYTSKGHKDVDIYGEKENALNNRAPSTTQHSEPTKAAAAITAALTERNNNSRSKPTNKRVHVALLLSIPSPHPALSSSALSPHRRRCLPPSQRSDGNAKAAESSIVNDANKKSKPSLSASAISTSSVPSSAPSVSLPSAAGLSALLAEKDAAYALLLSKYEAAKSARLSSAHSLFTEAETTAQQHLAAAQQLATHWKAQHDALTASHSLALTGLTSSYDRRLQALTAQSDTLSASVTAMQAQLSSAERVIEGHMLLLGGRVRVLEDGRAVVKLVNGPEGRCVEFVLDGEKEQGQVEYRPKVIDMAGEAYPSELRGPMTFRTERTPNFTRYLLTLLYRKSEAGDLAGRDEEAKDGVTTIV